MIADRKSACNAASLIFLASLSNRPANSARACCHQVETGCLMLALFLLFAFLAESSFDLCNGSAKSVFFFLPLLFVVKPKDQSGEHDDNYGPRKEEPQHLLYIRGW